MLSKKQFGILPVPSVATGLPTLLWRINSVLNVILSIVHIAEKKAVFEWKMINNSTKETAQFFFEQIFFD